MKKTGITQLTGARHAPEIERILELEELLRRREQKEESLLLALNHYSQLLEASPDVIYTVDREGRFISLNSAFKALTGYRPENWLGKPFLDLAFPEDHERVRRVLWRMMRPEVRSRIYKARLRRRDGSTAWGEFTIRPLIKDGVLGGFFGIARDISLRVRAEEALRNSREQYRALFDDAPVGVYRSTVDGRVLIANPALVRMLGYGSQEELLALNIESGYTPDSPRSEFQRRVHAAGEIQGYETRWRRKDGTILHVRENARALKDARGAILGYEGTVEDISEHIKALEALRESEERYRQLFEKSPMGIYRTSVDGRFLMANPAMLRMLGYDSLEELAHINLLEQGYHPDTPRREFQERVHAEGEVRGYEAKWTGKDGSAIYIREYARMIRDPRGNPVAYEGTVEDITPLMESQEKIRKTMETLEGIFQVLPDLYFHMTSDGTVVNCMAGQSDDLYVSPEKFLGKKMQDVLPGPVGRRILRAIRDTLKRRARVTIEYPLPIEGAERHFEMRLIPLRGEEVIAVVHNITNRKLAETALLESENRFRTLAESALIGVYLIQVGTFRYVNPSLAQMLGCTPEALVDRSSLTDLAHPQEADRVEAHVKQCLTGTHPQGRLTFRAVRKDGTVLICEALMRRIEILGRSAVMGTLLDITEQERARDTLEENVRSLEHTVSGVIQAMIKVVEVRDPYTAGHQQRVAELATAIAAELKLEPPQVRCVRMAAMIHDIGKTYIPAEILSKPGELSPIEIEMIKTHPRFGHDIIQSIEFPGPIARIILQHHERLDGSGYPGGLRGGEILLEAKILMVADVVEAMASHRPYRSGHGVPKALQEITLMRGRYYDPDVVDACLALFKEKNFEFETSLADQGTYPH